MSKFIELKGGQATVQALKREKMPEPENIKLVFEKILLLEQSLKHSDSAVIGGLDAFIEKNSNSIYGPMIGANSRSYKTLTHPEKVEWVNQTLN